MKLKVAVCEDDTMICENIRKKILEIRPEYVIDTYAIGEKLLSEGKQYDVVFLDIEMPGKNGMCIAKELREKKYFGQIIFLTSHTEFTIEAFKVRAFRFLNKPIKVEDLKEALIESEKEIFLEQKLIITDYGTEILINLSEILYVEARKNKTVIYTMNHTFETNCSLKFWFQQLGRDEFFQVHKSYIVSLRYMKKLETDSVCLDNSQKKVPVSRRNVSLLKKAFFDYIRKNAKYL